MFRETDPQIPLFTAESSLPESARRRLGRSWARGFREKIYPELLAAEPEFSDLYHGSTGRPNWSVARKLGICLLQDMFDLDDQSALDALAFDARWQYALDLTPDDAYLSRRRFVDFRGRLVEVDPEMTRLRALFDRISQAAIDDLRVSTDRQRLDSTFFTSNIRTRGRLDLFRKTLRHFLDWLSSWAPRKKEQLDPDMLEWYGEVPQGTFGKATRAEVGARLLEVGGWLVEVLTVFGGDEQVSASEPYQLVARLVAEHCERIEVASEGDSGAEPSSEGGQAGRAHGPCDDDSDDGDPGGGGAEATSEGRGADDAAAAAAAGTADVEEEAAVYELLDAPVNGGASMQSPYDPDAGYGHKGKGYHAQITETCGNEGRPEVITDFAVHGSHVSDHGQTTEAIDRLAAVGRRPEELQADAGYTSGQAFLDASERGVVLVAPVTGQSKDALLRLDFELGEDGRVLRCPGGHAPVRHGDRVGKRGGKPTLHAYFDGETCRRCPLRGRCPVQVTAKARTGYLDIGPTARARDNAIAAQRDPTWWAAYRTRSGIEATNSELKRAHGLGRLRVRGLARVLLAVTSKLTACNIKRWLRASAHHQAAPSGPHSPTSGRSRALVAIWATRRVLSALTALLQPLRASRSTPAPHPLTLHAA